MENRKVGGMGIALVVAAGLFLFNPIVAFIDILPNCVGYLLLFIGLGKCADLNEHIFEARRKFRTLFILALFQPIACYLFYGVMQGEIFSASEGQLMTPNAYEQPVYLLLASFVLLVIQLYFLIPAFKELFLGMDRLAERYGMQGWDREKKGKTVTERMIGRTSLFVIVTSLASFLPELSILTSFENDVENKLFSFDWYDFVFLFRIFCFAVAGIVAVIWLISYIRFFAAFLREKAWKEQITSDYSARVLSQSGMLAVRRFSMAFSLLQIGILFTINLRLNDYLVLPSAVFAILAGIAVFVMEKRSARTKAVGVIGLVLVGVSVAQCVASHRYLRTYLPEASLYQPAAYWNFLTVQVLQVGEAILTGILVLLLLHILYRVAKEHTAVPYEEEAASHRSNESTARLQKAFYRQKNIVSALFIVASIANMAEVILQLQYPWLWLISVILFLIAIVACYSFLHELQSQIEFHYGSNGVNKNK